MPSAKKICIVCEKNISVTRGKDIKRCQQCNNTICNDHVRFCRICNQLICDNELRKCDYCPFDQCKNCTVKHRKDHDPSYSLCCTDCIKNRKNRKWNDILYIFFYCGCGMVIREHAHYLVEMLKDIYMLSCCFLVGVYFLPICSGQD